MSLDPAAQRRASPPLVTAIAGGLAGLTSRFVIAPLDVIKIRLQLQSQSSTTYRGALHAGKTILAQEGLTALWKGNIPAELLYVSYSMVQFVTYREVHVLLEQTHFPNRYRSFVAGASAGTCASLVTYPLDLLRTRFAAQGTEKVFSFVASLIIGIFITSTFFERDLSRRGDKGVLSRSCNISASDRSVHGDSLRNIRGFSRSYYENS
jgi:hypothetical protein